MRSCRGRFRFLPARTKYLLLTTFKVILVLCAILGLLLFIQEKREKESLIELALGSRSSEELVKPDQDTLVINGLLGDNETGIHKNKNAFIVIVVTSLPENFERRQIIRKTWASKAHEHGTIVVFFLGRPSFDDMKNTLLEEVRQYKDMVIDDFQESYYALAIKTLRAIKYFKFHHPKSKFLVKTDDDVFVNVPNLVHYCYTVNQRFNENEKVVLGADIDADGAKKTEDKRPAEYYIGGVIHSDRGPHTWNPFSKWYAPADVWRSVFNAAFAGVQMEETKTNLVANEDDYPPYAEGNFYVMSSDAANDILNVSKSVPLYHLEDIHVTGVLATWMLKIEKETIPYISSSSNLYPKLSYFWYNMFTAASPKDVIAFHCDNHVELISFIYMDSI